MTYKRKHINEFLVALDRFIETYKNIIDMHDLRGAFMWPFIMSANDRKKSITKGKTVDVPNLVKIINPPVAVSQTQFQLKKKSFYTMCVAYGAEYKYVEDISYEHIFYKICLQEWLTVPFVDMFPEYLGKYQWWMKLFMIPELYHHNSDLLIY